MGHPDTRGPLMTAVPTVRRLRRAARSDADPTRASVDEEVDQGPDVLANLYALAAAKARAQGLLSAAEPVRGQSTRGR